MSSRPGRKQRRSSSSFIRMMKRCSTMPSNFCLPNAAITVTHGGPTRQQSVLAGLRKLDRAEITHVLIQDARAALHRPCASGSHHRRLRSRCGGGPACRCCRPDTLKRGRSIGSRYGNGAARWPFWRTDAAGLPLLIHPCRPHRRPIVRPDRFHRRRGDRRMGKHAGSADSGPA